MMGLVYVFRVEVHTCMSLYHLAVMTQPSGNPILSPILLAIPLFAGNIIDGM